MSKDEHFSDEIEELIDRRLPAELRIRVEQHLLACNACRREHEALSRTKQAVRRTLGVGEAPPELSRAVAEALDREDRPGRRPARPAMRLVVAAALLAAAVATLLLFLPKRPDLPAMVGSDFDAYRSGRLSLTLETGETRALEGFFVRAGIPFPTRVFDLAMMNYRLVGGRAHSLAGRPSAFFVYRGEGNRILVCQMYRGNTADLPGGAERIEHNGIVFYLYRRDGLTEVFWQEGDITCVLVSDAPPEETTSLAFAKAVKV